MKLKYYHDFTGKEEYPLPFVLVYRGTLLELAYVKHWCMDHLEDKTWTAGEVMQVDDQNWSCSFHFIEKSSALWCRMSH
jgi:hypothetical protein